jgi:hypothetical protein
MNNYTSEFSAPQDHFGTIVVHLLEAIGVVLAAIGVLLNAIICFTLLRIPNFIAPNPRIITISQTVCDGLSCLITLIYTYTAQYATTLNVPSVMNQFLCFLWFSTWLTWAEFGCSIWNNAILTIERYVAICYVFSKWFTRRRVIILCVLCQVVWLGTMTQIPFKQTQVTVNGCITVPETSYLRVWGPVFLITYFIIPAVIMVSPNYDSLRQ